MRAARAAAIVVCAAAVAGCSIRPQPIQSTGVSTFDIVRQIRCEAREAFVDLIIHYLGASDHADARSKAEARRFAADREAIRTLDVASFSPTINETLSIFLKTGLAYNFKLTGTEVNNLGGSINLARTVAPAPTLGLGADFNRQRANTRTFTVTDTAGDLVARLPSRFCEGAVVIENYVYPIAGRIGVKDMLQTFVLLSIYANLGQSADKPRGPPTMVDALEFTTTISGRASPRIVFAPGGRNFTVADASLSGVASRTDTHQVVMAVALPVDLTDDIRAYGATIFGRLASAEARGVGEANAATAVNQYLAQNLLRVTIQAP